MKDEIKEIKINKANKSITFINNGIAFSQFGVADEILDLITNLEQENKKKDNIINELEIWLSNEINFQKVVGRDWELRKVWFELQNIKENILTGGDE